MRLLCFGIPFLRERPVAALKGAGIATLVHLRKRSSPARGTGTGLSAVGAHHRWGQERVSRRRSEAPPPGSLLYRPRLPAVPCPRCPGSPRSTLTSPRPPPPPSATAQCAPLMTRLFVQTAASPTSRAARASQAPLTPAAPGARGAKPTVDASRLPQSGDECYLQSHRVFCRRGVARTEKTV